MHLPYEIFFLGNFPRAGGDPWKADLRITFDKDTFFKAKKPLVGDKAYREWYAKDERNRAYMNTEARTSQAVTFENGIQFIRQNHALDDWPPYAEVAEGQSDRTACPF